MVNTQTDRQTDRERDGYIDRLLILLVQPAVLKKTIAQKSVILTAYNPPSMASSLGHHVWPYVHPSIIQDDGWMNVCDSLDIHPAELFRYHTVKQSKSK